MKWLTRLLVLLVLAALGGWGLYYALQEKPLRVVLGQVSRGAIESSVVNTRAGTVKACRRSGLSPATGGQISQWPVKEGMAVKKGDLLLALWNDDLKAQLAAAESEAAAARARADSVCLQADLADRQSGRYQRLADRGTVSRDELDRVASKSSSSRAECASARAAAAAAEDRITAVNTALERTLLRAPFDGVIASLNGELGEFITPSPLGVKTLPAVDLIDPTCYYVSAPFDEVDAPRVRVGMPARITLDAVAGRSFTGQVQRIADFVLDLEKQARTVEIEVAFSDPVEKEGVLLAGYSADAEVILAVREDALRVPTEAVTEGNSVYVYHPDRGILEKRTVATGLANWQFTEITSGLEPDEQVVISVEQQGLADGVRADHE